MNQPTLAVREGYANWARTYDLEDNALVRLEEQTVANLLSDIPRVALDAACGTGRHATRLALGGSAVIGVDISGEMLAVARAKSLHLGGLPIQYVQSSIDHGPPIRSASVDLAVCALALCHVTDLRSAVVALCRTVRRDGHVLLTDLHPAAVAAGLVTLFSAGGVQHAIATVQHSTQAYVNALNVAGAQVLSISELALGDAFEHEPRGLPNTVYEQGWRDLPFCLVIASRVSR